MIKENESKIVFKCVFLVGLRIYIKITYGTWKFADVCIFVTNPTAKELISRKGAKRAKRQSFIFNLFFAGFS